MNYLLFSHPHTQVASLIYSHLSVQAVRVYRFPVFEKSFCEELVEELEHFEQSSAPKGRPNTMNHYGVRYLFLLAETP